MPLTRSQRKNSKLKQLDQFAFHPSGSEIKITRKRKGDIHKGDNKQHNKRRKLNSNHNNKKYKKVIIGYDEHKESAKFTENKSVKIQESPFIPLTKEIINCGNMNQGPSHWNDVYRGVFNMRNDSNHIAHNAEVDIIGAACLFDKDADIKTQRFHVLVSLLLSSQTKDAVTARAMHQLREQMNGLTVESICNIKDIQEIDDAISCVGFHNKKSKYLFKTANILKNEYDGDIPNNIKDLCKLPGIGPKMAYIVMQIAWRQNLGIGVDVHVHRITNLLGWNRNKGCKTAEHTRKELQQWIPQQLWPSINRLFVGFGQTVCKPKKPKCGICQIQKWCPVGRNMESNK